MATIVADVGGGNWNTGSTWVGGVAPTAADDAQLTVTSGNVTIAATAACRSLDCTGYVGTLTHNTGIALNIGDGTAGLGNIALKLVAGMTYTLGSASTSAISFISTSATQQTIATGGKTCGNTTINGSGSSYLLSDSFTTGTPAAFTVTQGIFDSGTQAMTVGSFSSSGTLTRTVTITSSTITCTNAGGNAWAFTVITNLTFNSTGSTIVMSGGTGGAATTFSGGGLTYATVQFTGSGVSALSGANTFATLTRTGTASKTGAFQLGGNQTVTSALNLDGNSSTNRMLVQSTVLGTARTITITAATVSASNVDFSDITLSVATDLSAVTGKSGDCGGNSGITFTTAATQTATGTASFTWSTHGWTSRVPLPQDDVVINNAFSASQVITADMPRLGKSIDFTGATGTPALTVSAAIVTSYGSLTFISAMTITITTTTWNFEGRGSFTITSAGRDFSNISPTFQAPGGTYTLQDAFMVSAKTLALNLGTFTAGSFNVTALSLGIANVTGLTVNMGSGTWTLTSTGNVFNLNANTLATVNPQTSTIVISNTSSSAKAVYGGGRSFNVLNIPTGGSGTITIGNSSTYAVMRVTAPKTIEFIAGTTQTIGRLELIASAGNVATIASSVAASPATLTSSFYMHQFNFISVQDITVSGTSKWYAGRNSTNVSGNSGWQLRAGSSVFNSPGSMLGLAI